MAQIPDGEGHARAGTAPPREAGSYGPDHQGIASGNAQGLLAGRLKCRRSIKSLCGLRNRSQNGFINVRVFSTGLCSWSFAQPYDQRMDAALAYGQMLDEFRNRPAVSRRLEAPLLKRESVHRHEERITRGCEVV